MHMIDAPIVVYSVMCQMVLAGTNLLDDQSHRYINELIPIGTSVQCIAVFGLPHYFAFLKERGYAPVFSLYLV